MGDDGNKADAPLPNYQQGFRPAHVLAVLPFLQAGKEKKLITAILMPHSLTSNNRGNRFLSIPFQLIQEFSSLQLHNNEHMPSCSTTHDGASARALLRSTAGQEDMLR